MASYNNPGLNLQQPQYGMMGQMQMQMQPPYGNNNMLLSNTPYDNYMEGKEMHNDPKSQLKELEAYLQELSTDVTEMIKDASPEEKATLRQKMTTLASKIA